MEHKKLTSSDRIPFSIGNLSIRQQLPLLISLLLLVLILLFGSISYLGVRRASMAIGEQRLRTLTEELSSMFQQSGSTLSASTQKFARQDDIVHFFDADSSSFRGNDSRRFSSGKALEALQKTLADSQTTWADLRDLQGRVLLRAGKPQGGALTAGETGKRFVEPDAAIEVNPARHDSNFVGKFYLTGDSMYFPLVATVRANGKPAGYLFRWRPVRATQKTLTQLSQLLGAKAALYFGNFDGSLWTDMLHPVTNTSPAVKNLHKAVHYDRPGGKVIAYAMPITGTEWLIMVELSEDLILEAADRFLYWMIGIGVVLLITGSWIAWLISRNVTRRLDRLMHATAAMAAGDYSSPVTVDRHDELGRLAASFNAMTAVVRHTQEELEKKVQRRTHELEAANKELEAFSYSVSHDLRAPLRAVSGYAMMLIEDYEDTFDEEARRITGNILSNVKMMGRLIDDLIEFSRLGKREPRQEITDMKTLADDCVATLVPAWPEQKFRIDVAPLPACSGDRDLLRQVWANLIGNAMKYSSKQPDPCVTVGAMEEETGVVYFVRDNGAGFDMKYATKLFKVFQRLHSQDEFEGTGVGLALVKRILDKHRGRNMGGIFPRQWRRILFQATNTTYMLNQVEVLLVEDNIHDAEMTIRALRKVNLANNLVHVKDGEEALDFIFAQGKFSDRKEGDLPKVILLDIKMPKVDGIEVLRQLKSRESSKTIPVVIMTSSKEEQDIINSYQLGVNSYVVKPVDFDGFARAVSQLGMYWLLTNQPPLPFTK